MIIDPIENDGSAEELAAADAINEQREPTEREKRLNEIARQYEEANGIARVEAEFQDEGEGDTAPVTEFSEQPKVAPDPLAELGYYRNERGDLVTKMKINGEEREVKADQVKAYIQKDIAGDYKLQQSAERERRLQEREQLIQQRESQIQQSLSQRPSSMDANEAKEQAKAVLERMYDGDTDAAAEALATILQRNNATVDTSQILAAAESRALSAIEQRESQKVQQQWQSSVDEGNRFLIEKHPEIYNDQRLFDLVNGETARMVQAQQSGDPHYSTLTPKEIIAKAAEEVQGWMDGRKQKPPETTSREDRKAGLTRMPRSMNVTQKPKQKTEVDMSPGAIISRMKAGRAVIP